MFLKLFFLILPLVTVHAWYDDSLNGDALIPGKYDYCGVHDGVEESRQFLDEWTVVVNGDETMAQHVAIDTGFIYVGPVQGFANTYIFKKPHHSVQRRTFSNTSNFNPEHHQIKWAQQMFSKFRVKRYPPEEELFRAKRMDGVTERPMEKRGWYGQRKTIFNDELWSEEWYLQDPLAPRCSPRLDLNVLPVYEMGYNGHGVRISVLDDGIEHTHADLRANYDPEISWDCNDRDSDPSPRLSNLKQNSHGTRCAGEIAMAANNRKCGVGVAYGARIGGVRMLDGFITDRVEGEAIGYASDKVDIYSVSWGPYDDGRTVEGPGKMAREAIHQGINKGRDGKGTIYVWANGNGGSHFDNCNCDGYSSSIYTISVGSASQRGLFPWYGEICSSTLTTAYSSGDIGDQKIVTTDTNNSCTLSHSGTSAAAPLAAGIIALVLQSNPNLTWRDVQHLIVWTSDYKPLIVNPDWIVNGVGLLYNIRFGFGLLNAGNLVTTAKNWINVPDKHVCNIPALIQPMEVLLGSRKTSDIYFKVKGSACPVNYIEHIEVLVNIQHSRRGALELYLGSPKGTLVQLLSARPNDYSSRGFVNWSFMSVATWGENPIGIWQVKILEHTYELNNGYVESITLIIHGTTSLPRNLLNGRRQFDYVFDNSGDDSDIEIEEDDNYVENQGAAFDNYATYEENEEQEIFRRYHMTLY